MSTLEEENDPSSVASWTKKKKIDIFKKKLIFVPVNADLHWSLCVIVNPGLLPPANVEGEAKANEGSW
jgi:Ulp1 family protease